MEGIEVSHVKGEKELRGRNYPIFERTSSCERGASPCGEGGGRLGHEAAIGELSVTAWLELEKEGGWSG